MMVASHLFDLQAAQKAGFKTAYIYRSQLIDSIGTEYVDSSSDLNIVVRDFVELVDRLGA